MSRTRLFLVGLVAACTAAFAVGLSPDSYAGDDDVAKEAKAEPVAVDKKLPAVTMKDTDGKALDLHDCGIKKEDAQAVVLAAAKKLGVKAPTAETKVADMPGMKDDDGDLDSDAVKTLACSVGSYFGLVATSDTVARFKTLGDLSSWIAKADGSPILLVTWSPNCPSVKKANDRIIEVAAKLDVRIFALGCNTRDTDEHYAKYLDVFDFPVRVFPDREQKVTDIVGAKTTPHFFVLDKDAVLRYSGSLDNDPMGYMDDDEREDYVEDAVTALRTGKPVATKTTDPAG